MCGVCRTVKEKENDYAAVMKPLALLISSCEDTDGRQILVWLKVYRACGGAERGG